MEVDVDEFVVQTFVDLEIAPTFGVNILKVQFHNDYVDVVEVFEGEVLESWDLASFGIDLKSNVFVDEAARPQNVFQSVVSVL